MWDADPMFMFEPRHHLLELFASHLTCALLLCTPLHCASLPHTLAQKISWQLLSKQSWFHSTGNPINHHIFHWPSKPPST
jgi:hypothetical protein